MRKRKSPKRQFSQQHRVRISKALKKFNKAKRRTKQPSYTIDLAMLRRLEACHSGIEVWSRAFGERPQSITVKTFQKYLRVRPFPDPWGSDTDEVGPNREHIKWLVNRFQDLVASAKWKLFHAKRGINAYDPKAKWVVKRAVTLIRYYIRCGARP